MEHKCQLDQIGMMNIHLHALVSNAMNGKWLRVLKKLVGMKNALVVVEINLKNVTVQLIGKLIHGQK